MITYVNSVFVSNATTASIPTTEEAVRNIAKGQFAIMNCSEDVTSENAYVDDLADVKKFKIGMGTGKKIYDQNGEQINEIRWSNIIVKDDIKSVSKLEYPGEDTEDAVEIDFTNIDGNLINLFAQGGKRIIIRLTFKDLPTRFRKWTESYEYVTVPADVTDGEDRIDYVVKIVDDIRNLINKQWKRARINATKEDRKLTLTAMKYDDDNSVDSINWSEKVRFNANIYYTDPAAEGWESLNKHFPIGVTIEKKPGTTYAASAKLVRDRESQAMGYLGILNRGEGTWPIIKPAMETQLDGHYDALTIEFENMYRTADDLFRKTKQTVEIYTKNGSGFAASLFSIFTGDNNDRQIVDTMTEKGNIGA